MYIFWKPTVPLAQTKKSLLCSTGMSTEAEIKEAVEAEEEEAVVVAPAAEAEKPAKGAGTSED